MSVIRSFYVNPQFRIKDNQGNSQYYKQRAGIRQGCPLSPYLFILLMTVIFHDVHKAVNHLISPYCNEVLHTWELLYADDTIVMGSRAREINIILKQIEIESGKYNLSLNKDKCFYIGMNGTANIHFKDGTKIKKTDNIMYLGGTITENASRNSEVSSRMSKALATCHKLKIFWRKTNVGIAWKLQVYNAIILAQLTYGLNTLNITPGIKNRLNSFHMRGLRYILDIDHSYYSRVSNEQVVAKANLLLNSIPPEQQITWHQFKVDCINNNHEYKNIKLVGEIILDRQQTLLGHLIRSPMSNLQRKVAFDEKLKRPHQLYKKTGHPRSSWVDDNLQRAFLRQNLLETYNPENQTHVDCLIEAATNYAL